MAYFTHILLHNIIPLSLMIAVGVLLQRLFKLDIRTLSKLNFYLFSPAVMFKMLYESNLSFGIMMQVLLFFAIFFGLLFLLMELVVRVRRYEPGMRSAMRNSVIFYNSANYAIPLNQLVFVGDPFTLSIQIIIMMMQSLLPNTYGVYSVNVVECFAFMRRSCAGLCDRMGARHRRDDGEGARTVLRRADLAKQRAAGCRV